MSTKQIVSVKVPLSSKFQAFIKWILSCNTNEQLITMEFVIRRCVREHQHEQDIDSIRTELTNTLQMQRIYLSIRNCNFPSITQSKN